jgi:hypothetical protein
MTTSRTARSCPARLPSHPPERMQQALKAPAGAAGTEVVPAELRLPLGSKGGEVLELAPAHHIGPPLDLPGHSGRGRGVSQKRAGCAGERPPATDPAFGRKGPQVLAGPTEPARSANFGAGTESKRRDHREGGFPPRAGFTAPWPCGGWRRAFRTPYSAGDTQTQSG